MKSVSEFNKKIGKKGFIQDIFLAMLFLFIFAIVTYISLVVYNEYRDNTGDDFEGTDAGKQIVSDAIRVLDIWDYAFLMLFGGLLISTVVTAFFIRSHPALFVLSLIVLFVVLIMAVVFSNVFGEFETHRSIQNATDTYTIIPEIMGGFPKYIFGFFILVALAFFAKAKMEQGGL
ncbi:unnamed protein product [marine sediment metagenome]|uniref:Uncharacterized protein n=1 Tax=marine sediment metagenome TaxID=412755 RepID=X1GDM7_9ZZZZ